MKCPNPPGTAVGWGSAQENELLQTEGLFIHLGSRWNHPDFRTLCNYKCVTPFPLFIKAPCSPSELSFPEFTLPVQSAKADCLHICIPYPLQPKKALKRPWLALPLMGWKGASQESFPALSWKRKSRRHVHASETWRGGADFCTPLFQSILRQGPWIVYNIPSSKTNTNNCIIPSLGSRLAWKNKNPLHFQKHVYLRTGFLTRKNVAGLCPLPSMPSSLCPSHKSPTSVTSWQELAVPQAWAACQSPPISRRDFFYF